MLLTFSDIKQTALVALVLIHRSPYIGTFVLEIVLTYAFSALSKCAAAIRSSFSSTYVLILSADILEEVEFLESSMFTVSSYAIGVSALQYGPNPGYFDQKFALLSSHLMSAALTEDTRLPVGVTFPFPVSSLPSAGASPSPVLQE